MMSLVNTGPDVQQEVSLGYVETNARDGWPSGCMLDLVVRPIPIESNPGYCPLTGKVEQAELHHIHFEGMVNEYVDYSLTHCNVKAIHEMEAWAKEFELSASKLRLAISRMVIEDISSPKK